MSFNKKAMDYDYRTKSLVFCAALQGEVTRAMLVTDFVITTGWVFEGSSYEYIKDAVQDVLEQIKGIESLEECKVKLQKYYEEVESMEFVSVEGAE
ncbi:hypothetical protein [Bacillus thuringiensis]|uniref:hypothetical protein n=1 Tax=Bacillus thuringiensis TaxID=1428 RepID=UPI003459DC19